MLLYQQGAFDLINSLRFTLIHFNSENYWLTFVPINIVSPSGKTVYWNNKLVHAFTEWVTCGWCSYQLGYSVIPDTYHTFHLYFSVSCSLFSCSCCFFAFITLHRWDNTICFYSNVYITAIIRLPYFNSVWSTDNEI